MSDSSPEPFSLDSSMLVGRAEGVPPAAAAASTGPHLSAGEGAGGAAQSFAALREAAAARGAGVGRAGATIEDIVREEVRPLLTAWLDRHLPEMVERIVRAEVQRIAGS